MELLLELININKQVENSLFESQLFTLLEDLGNLKKLNVGSMINAFKQTYGGGKKSGASTGEVGNKLTKHWSGRIGKDSPVVETDTQIKNWGGFRRVIEKTDGNPVGAVIHLDKKPVAVLVLNGTPLQYKNDIVGLAWDLSKTGLSDEIKTGIMTSLAMADSGYNRIVSKTSKDKSVSDSVKFERFYKSDKVAALEKAGKPFTGERKVPVKDYETWYDAMKDGGAKVDRSEDLVTAEYKDQPVGEWNKKTGKGFFIQRGEYINPRIEHIYDKPKQIQGIAQPVENVRAFIEALVTHGIVTLTVILTDVEGQKKTGDRRAVGGPAEEKTAEQSKADLKKRLALFKATKLDTAEDGFDFLKKVFEGKAKKINFMGKTWTAIPAEEHLGSNYSKGHQTFTNSTMKNLITGKAVEIKFEADRDVSGYESLRLGVKLVGGVLTLVTINGKAV